MTEAGQAAEAQEADRAAKAHAEAVAGEQAAEAAGQAAEFVVQAGRRKLLKIAVFASGNGSNFQALVDAAQAGQLDARIELLVCDRPSTPVVGRAERAGIATWVFTPKAYPNRQAYEQEIVAELQRLGVELVVLAGYMRILTEVLVDAYEGRMINVHPSLLPAFPGVDGIGQALAYGVKLTGVTVHLVDGGLDSGPIIAQRAVEVADGETADTLAPRIHAVEQQLLPWVVQQFAEGRVRVSGRLVDILT